MLNAPSADYNQRSMPVATTCNDLAKQPVTQQRQHHHRQHGSQDAIQLGITALPLFDHATEAVAGVLGPGVGLVDPADAFVVEVLWCRGAAQHATDPAIDAG